jgi:hypothetical protein
MLITSLFSPVATASLFLCTPINPAIYNWKFTVTSVTSVTMAPEPPLQAHPVNVVPTVTSVTSVTNSPTFINPAIYNWKFTATISFPPFPLSQTVSQQFQIRHASRNSREAPRVLRSQQMEPDVIYSLRIRADFDNGLTIGSVQT